LFHTCEDCIGCVVAGTVGTVVAVIVSCVGVEVSEAIEEALTGIAAGTEGLVAVASVLDFEVTSEVAAIFELEGADVLIDVFEGFHTINTKKSFSEMGYSHIFFSSLRTFPVEMSFWRDTACP